MKILFLDVDGVLNTTKSTTFLSLSKPKLRLLEKIVKETGCYIVLSSTWRKDNEAYMKLVRTLLYRNIIIHDITPTLWKDRGYEIEAWLNDNPHVEKYAILDDDSDMLDTQLRHFFQTDPEYGLTDTIAYRVIYHLNN